MDNEISNFIKKNQFAYIEPFVGAGAVFFWTIKKYPNINKAIINDINSDFINTYRIIKENVEKLMQIQIKEKSHIIVNYK
ncbi:MAG: DNA adenine methylase [Bacteroidales bacterium]